MQASTAQEEMYFHEGFPRLLQRLARTTGWPDEKESPMQGVGECHPHNSTPLTPFGANIQVKLEHLRTHLPRCVLRSLEHLRTHLPNTSNSSLAYRELAKYKNPLENAALPSCFICMWDQMRMQQP